MVKSELSQHHWRFALTCSLHRLEELVWKFDFLKESGPDAYTGVQSPSALTHIIDGFIAEGERVCYAGDVARLVRMRSYLRENILPIYRQGQASAKLVWTTSGQPYDLLTATIDDVRERAIRTLPKALSPTEAAWYMEGFCKQWWASEYPTYLTT